MSATGQNRSGRYEVSRSNHQHNRSRCGGRPVPERLPVTLEHDRVTVDTGFGKLVLTRGAPFEGAHHLAFGISPDDFDLARQADADDAPLARIAAARIGG
ncbi:hypothetical protein ACIBCN_38160 [Nocardia sp. NPDC051052]|uniref:hypothetical protein n=1 Tax=Nocardia sp. NPDC051052 TaxID=3364322 RepID=UPI00379136C1